MVAINTHSVFSTSPTSSSFTDRNTGLMRASSKIFTLPPGNGGNRRREMGIMRAASAFACAIVVSGFSRAIPR